MNAKPDLLTAIRSGRLDAVRAALDSGQTLEGEGEPGLAMGMACFFGHVNIVRELVARGAGVNIQDNKQPTSPLSMAVRGNKTEVVRTLLELGAVLPEGMKTGLSADEIKAAQWIALKDGKAAPEVISALTGGGEVVEIDVGKPRHVDTQILEAEMLREALGQR